jgi:hypothetical protein
MEFLGLSESGHPLLPSEGNVPKSFTDPATSHKLK